MCLAVPMRIISCSGFTARCEARNVQREVSLFLLEDGSVTIGDYVLVHVGHAIQVMSPQDAEDSWVLFDEIAAALDQEIA
jgi:hydrogenase expression/formation protein HypC